MPCLTAGERERERTREEERGREGGRDEMMKLSACFSPPHSLSLSFSPPSLSVSLSLLLLTKERRKVCQFPWGEAEEEPFDRTKCTMANKALKRPSPTNEFTSPTES